MITMKNGEKIEILLTNEKGRRLRVITVRAGADDVSVNTRASTKEDVADAPSCSKSDQILDQIRGIVGGTTAAPAKKRGRRPKETVAPAATDAVAPKKRGRPKKDATATAAPAATDAVAPKKRGRPKKDATAVAPAATDAPKKRGRPKKDATATVAPAATDGAAPKKRGRPKKVKVEVVNPVSLNPVSEVTRAKISEAQFEKRIGEQVAAETERTIPAPEPESASSELAAAPTD